MAKFYFNPETLEYRKIELSRKQKFFNFLRFATVVILFLSLTFYVSSEFLQSPKYNRLTGTQQQLAYQIELLNRNIIAYEKVLEDIEYNDDHLYRVYFEVDPVPSTKRDAGTGGVNKYRDFIDDPFANLLIPAFMNLDKISHKLVIQSKSFDEVIEMAKNKEEILAARPAIQPISFADLTRFGSSFGMRFHPILKVMRPHQGIDLTAPKGTNIYASADGTVLQAAYTTGGFGKKILIDHGFGYKTLYGHCSELLVEKGQKVKRGEVIGLVGNTGLSKGSHLHYEVWINNKPVNPINYYANDLSADEYDQMINLLSNADQSFDIN